MNNNKTNHNPLRVNFIPARVVIWLFGFALLLGSTVLPLRIVQAISGATGFDPDFVAEQDALDHLGKLINQNIDVSTDTTVFASSWQHEMLVMVLSTIPFMLMLCICCKGYSWYLARDDKWALSTDVQKCAFFTLMTAAVAIASFVEYNLAQDRTIPYWEMSLPAQYRTFCGIGMLAALITAFFTWHLSMGVVRSNDEIDMTPRKRCWKHHNTDMTHLTPSPMVEDAVTAVMLYDVMHANQMLS